MCSEAHQLSCATMPALAVLTSAQGVLTRPHSQDFRPASALHSELSELLSTVCVSSAQNHLHAAGAQLTGFSEASALPAPSCNILRDVHEELFCTQA